MCLLNTIMEIQPHFDICLWVALNTFHKGVELGHIDTDH